MRILVEPMGYHVLNLGDLAMRQVAAARLRDLWPEARIEILTDDPATLGRLVPEATAVATTGRRAWFYAPAVRPAARLLPSRTYGRLVDAERTLRRRAPRATQRFVTLAGALTRRPRNADREFLELVFGADLVVVSGGGAINDEFAGPITSVLDVLELASRRGIPTAMMSQGLGPLTDARLLARARSVLPWVDVIALRESATGQGLLAELGVRHERVFVTGDDAIEPAFAARRHEIAGEGLGLNVRVAGYSPLEDQELSRVVDGLRRVLAAVDTSVVLLPISRHPGERDLEVAAELASRAGRAAEPSSFPGSPAEAIARTSSCRVVLSGSYHAAVFALAQGIPAVCLAGSAYYVHKFEGLRDLFGAGCAVVGLDRADAPERIEAAVLGAWQSAADLRPPLLAAAERQVEAGRAAYARLRDVVP